MDAMKFIDNLDKLLTKDVINDGDVLHYVKSLVELSKEVKLEGRFQTFGPIIKKWISAFQIIFREPKIDGNFAICIRKYCKVLTEVFLNLMEIYHKHDPGYHQEFHYHWKSIISATSGERRAKYFCLFSKQFKVLIENLRTATHRCEQFAILSVLLLYIEQVPSDQFTQLKEGCNSYSYILNSLVVLKKKPTILNQHSFLQDIDASGHSIISMKATQIICASISLNMNTSMYALWIDFNLYDSSITLCGVSPSDNTVVLFATLSMAKLRERLATEHELQIRGLWSIFKRGTNSFKKKTTITVHLPIGDRNAVWKAKVKSLFHFSTNSSESSQSMSEYCASDLIDQQLAKLSVDGIRHGNVSQDAASLISLSTLCSQIVKRSPITPIAPQQSDDDFPLFRDDVATKPSPKSQIGSMPAIDKSQTDRSKDSAVLVDQQSFQGLPYSQEMSFGENEEREDDRNSQNCSPRSSAFSEHSFSLANENVRKFLMTTEPTHEELAVKDVSSSEKQRTQGNLSIAEIKCAVQKLIGNISPVSKHLDQQTEYKATPGTIIRSRSSSVPSSQSANSSRSQPVQHKSIEQMLPERMPHQEQSTSVEREHSLTVLVPSKLPEESSRKAQDLGNVVQPTESIQTSQNLNFPKDDWPNEMNGNETNAIHKVDDVDVVDNECRKSPAGPEPNDLSLKIDTEGVVVDAHGCVFVNEDEMQEAYFVYIENNGLVYLNSDEFKRKSPTLRKRNEREFRAIHKMIDAEYEADQSIMVATRKRKSWNSFVNQHQAIEQSEGEDQRDECFEQLRSYKKTKNSDEAEDNNVDTPVCVPEPQNLQMDVDDQPYDDRCKDVSCTTMALKSLIDFLKVFCRTHETCEIHQLLLSQLIERLQSINTQSSTSEELFSATLSQIKTICQQTRAYIELILQKVNNE